MPTATGTQTSDPVTAPLAKLLVTAVSPQTATSTTWNSAAKPTSTTA